MKQENINQIGLLLAVFSFVIGTALFLIYKISHSENVLIIGLLYVTVTVLINTLTLLYFAVMILLDQKKWKTYLQLKRYLSML